MKSSKLHSIQLADISNLIFQLNIDFISLRIRQFREFNSGLKQVLIVRFAFSMAHRRSSIRSFRCLSSIFQTQHMKNSTRLGFYSSLECAA